MLQYFFPRIKVWWKWYTLLFFVVDLFITNIYTLRSFQIEYYIDWCSSNRRHIQIIDSLKTFRIKTSVDNSSNLLIGCGFGFLQKSVLKNPDFLRITVSWNFSGLRIFGLGLLILAIFLNVYFWIKICIKFSFFIFSQ